MSWDNVVEIAKKMLEEGLSMSDKMTNAQPVKLLPDVIRRDLAKEHSDELAELYRFALKDTIGYVVWKDWMKHDLSNLANPSKLLVHFPKYHSTRDIERKYLEAVLEA